MTFAAGDVLLVAGDSKLSKLIEKFERSPDQPPAIVSHGAVLSGPDSVIEALTKVVERGFREAYIGKRVAVFRPVHLGPEKCALVVMKARTYVGRTYGYVKIVAHLGDWLVSKMVGRNVFFFRRLARMDNYPICTWVVGFAYDEVHERFGVPPEVVQPDDIWNYVTRHPERYECVHPLGVLEATV